MMWASEPLAVKRSRCRAFSSQSPLVESTLSGQQGRRSFPLTAPPARARRKKALVYLMSIWTQEFEK